MSFGQKLMELRKQRGLSQEILATDLGVSQSSISNYESGATRPDIIILERVSDYFSVPVSELLSDEQNTFYYNHNSGGQNGYIVNHLPEQLIEQYEKRIEQYEKRLQEKDEIIALLKESRGGVK